MPSPAASPNCSAGRSGSRPSTASASRARRRQHRRQRTRAVADHRGMSAQLRCRPATRGCRRRQLEAVLCENLGVQKVLWLNRGIAGDDTHGHVDDLARFVGERTVVIVVEDDPDDENYEPLQENLRTAQRHDRPGRPAAGGGARCRCRPRWCLPANGCRRATPTSTSPTTACWCRRSTTRWTGWRWERWPSCFPGREVVGIHAVDLVWGLGTLHCLTQQEPAAVRSPIAAVKRAQIARSQSTRRPRPPSTARRRRAAGRPWPCSCPHSSSG